MGGLLGPPMSYELSLHYACTALSKSIPVAINNIK